MLEEMGHMSGIAETCLPVAMTDILMAGKAMIGGLSVAGEDNGMVVAIVVTGKGMVDIMTEVG
jgi:hypothetical protein